MVPTIRNSRMNEAKSLEARPADKARRHDGEDAETSGIAGPVRSCLIGRLACGMTLLAMLLTGCARGPMLIPPDERTPIDRSLVEYPGGYELRPHVRNLTAPTAMAFDEDEGPTYGTLIIAEAGVDGHEPRVFGYYPDGTQFQVYPLGPVLPFKLNRQQFRIYGPIGGMAVSGGKIFVSHRDSDGFGVITAFGYDGSHSTVVADLPARGDHSVTDIAISPTGRLFFGVGSATNSGVVGVDNWEAGWLKRYPNVHDLPYVESKLLGYRFDTPNPRAGLFGGNDIAVTAAFHTFDTSNRTRVPPADNGKPSAAVYSISQTGGDLRVEAHGVRYPRGISFNDFGRPYMTNNGMELRGTRPVKDDPDSLLWIIPGTSYGWPDYSADLRPISEAQFQPPTALISKTGYPELSALIDHEASNLLRPNAETLVQGVFSPLSGAAKMDFIPSSSRHFEKFQGQALVALFGSRAPFATNGRKLKEPVGRKVVTVNIDAATGQRVNDFIYNTKGVPASMLGRNVEALERPIDVKIGPDGMVYILDYGRMRMKGGREDITPRTGRIFRLVPLGYTDPGQEKSSTAPVMTMRR